MNTDITPADILAAPDAEIEVALRDAPHEVAAHIWQSGGEGDRGSAAHGRKDKVTK